MKEIVPQGERERQYERSFPFDNGEVTIRFTLADIKADVIDDATKQLDGREGIEQFVEGVHFYFSAAELNNARGVDPKYKNPTSFGQVWKDTYGSHCYVDIEGIVKDVDKVKDLSKFKKIPSFVYSDTLSKQEALAQMIPLVWTHERQHVIQEMSANDPDTDFKHYRRIGRGIQLASYSAVGVGVVNNSLLTAYTALACGLVGLGVLSWHKRFRSPAEKDAIAHQTAQGPSPITLTFKK